MRTFKQHLNEGQLKIDFKKFARSEKKKIIKLLNSLEVKRKFNLDSVTSPMLDRSVTVYAYYLDLNDLMDYLKDKGYKWKEGPKMRRTDRPSDIYLENLDEAEFREANNKTAFLQRVMPRFPGLDKKLGKDAWDRIVQVVKPKNNINSKRYVELGKIFDTGNFRKLYDKMADMEKEDGIR